MSESSSPESGIPESGIPESPSGDAADALAELDALDVVARPKPDPSYKRSAFGSRWADVDHNGCNTRDDILFRDVDKGKPYTAAQQGRCDHDMLAGTWLDPYTGKELVFADLKEQRQAQAIQIDHILPLAAAWRYGAKNWTDAQRKEFANDPENLLAVDGAKNQSKSDGDAAAWRPRKEFQCKYAGLYVAVKTKWNLPVDASEKRALEEMLGTC
ncbi:MAG: HNH endonuclease family protein [Propionibacteriaceae bacterium]|nr:HNH endonuclease family protein [Propionibacteriaceae bacterium]